MSIASEITRLQNAKSSLKTKLNAKNDSSHQITNEKLDEYEDFVDTIPTGTDTSDATLSSNSELLSGVTAYAQGTKYTGSMANKGSKTFTPSTSQQTDTAGYYSDITVNAVTSSIDANITAGNIKKDVSILGVTGSYEGTTPTGTINITQNDTYDVTNYASAVVSVSGGSSEEIVYDNWIAYGISTPSASNYKYWLPVNTTPLSKPLKYVKNYKIANYLTGDLGALADETTGIEYRTQSDLSIFGIKSDRYNNYFYSSEGQGETPANITIYKYTYNSETTLLPNYDLGNTTKMTYLGTLASLLNLSGNTIYGCWTAYNNTIYGCFGNSILAYNVGTSSLSTWASSSTTILSSSYKGLGLIRRSTNQMLVYRTNSLGTTLEVLGVSNSGTVSTLATLTGLSNMTSYNVLQISTTQGLAMYKGTSWSMTNSTQNKLYYCGTSSITERTYPFNTGTMSARYLAPENKPIFTFSANPYEVYTASDTGIATYSSWGNLGEAVLKNDIGSIGYLSGYTVKACVPANNFSIKDTSDVIHTVSFNSGNGYSYNLLSFVRNTNYEIETETIESENSNDNVLLISNYKDNVPTQSYAFYPTPTSNLFLWLYRYNNAIKFIYQQTEYTMQVSVNNSWVTNDTDNNIL